MAYSAHQSRIEGAELRVQRAHEAIARGHRVGIQRRFAGRAAGKRLDELDRAERWLSKVRRLAAVSESSRSL